MKNYSLALYENFKKKVEIIMQFENIESAGWYFENYIYNYCKRTGQKARFFNYVLLDAWKYGCLNIGKSKFILKEL